MITEQNRKACSPLGAWLIVQALVINIPSLHTGSAPLTSLPAWPYRLQGICIDLGTSLGEEYLREELLICPRLGL